MQLSDHFTLTELTKSDYAIRNSVDAQFNPSQDVINSLIALSKNVLEKVRELTDKPVIISSGYRCSEVNKAIGGAETSQHVKGQAADITVYGMSVEDLYQLIKKSDVQFDQLIQEFGQWVHISYVNKGRRQCLRAVKQNGATKYLND